jgi:hypothetical protein
MKRMKLFALAAVLTAASFAAPQAGAKCTPPDVCPTIWDPVVCKSDGQFYSNKCFAAAACATGCVPTDEFGTKP